MVLPQGTSYLPQSPFTWLVQGQLMFQPHPGGLLGQQRPLGRSGSVFCGFLLCKPSQEEGLTPDPGPYGVGPGHTVALGCVRRHF